jgi:hypothetical protein
MFMKVLRKIDAVVFGKWFQKKYGHHLAAKTKSSLDSYFDFKIISYYAKDARDDVAKLCDKYGSDKGEIRKDGHPYLWPSHTYADFYSRLFSHCREGVTRVFECGLGTDNPNLPSSMGSSGKPGASLRVWRDFFPNANVYGADIDRDVLFEEHRIKTFYIDQLDPVAIEQFWKEVGESDFDFMLDDGLHTFEAGSTLFLNSIDKLSKNGIYIIEDVFPTDMLRYMDFFENTNYAVEFVSLHLPSAKIIDNSLVVVRKRS